MDLNELTKILSDKDGLYICTVCNTPFSPRNSRQKTCGSPDCKRIHHSRYVTEYGRTKREANREAMREYNKLKMRKYRKKQKLLDEYDNQIDYWEERAREKNDNVTGLDYGKRSAEKLLAKVPKIDVTMGAKTNDNKNNQNE